MTQQQGLPRPDSLRHLALWISQREWWFLALAAPLLLFTGPWTLPAFVVIVALWLCRWLARGQPTVATPADLPIAVIVCMAGVGCWVSLDRTRSLAALWRLLLGVALYYGLANGQQGQLQRRWLPPAVIAGSLALTALTLLGTAWQSVRLFDLPQLYHYLPRLLRDVQDQNAFHPRVMGLALGAWLPLPLSLLLFGRKQGYRLLAGAAALAMGLTIVLTQSLQAAVGVACALLFLGFCWKRWFLLAVPLLLGVLGLGLSAYGLQRAAHAALALDSSLGIAASLRLDMWSRALAMIHDLPYTGIGLDAFAAMQSHFYPGVMLGPEPHAHNLFLQVALDLGLPGLLSLLWLLGSLGCAAWAASRTCRNPEHRALLLGALAGVVSYASSGLLDTIWTAKPSVLLWLLLGLLAALSAAADPSGQPAPGRTTSKLLRRALPLLLLLVVLLPGLLLSPGAPRVNLATVRAHALLLAAQRSVPSSALRSAPLSAQEGATPSLEALASLSADLQRALSVDPGNAHLYNLLGLTLAWAGQQPQSLSAFRQQVELDGQDPLARYAPFELLRRQAAGEAQGDRWEDTAWVYGHWVSRFPQRAENYILLALIRAEQQNRTAEGLRLLNQGIAARAQPGALLLHCLESLRTVDRTPGATRGRSISGTEESAS